ncbi:hypothetical protein SPRG_10287 [Saprolegnia parasitica CBS 223.65]|uniref:Palmitoyltransferase n=1 Tax=Saprolegnia parasitica (strain CBS 223.65) TaxID=695850 RepID=A0A067CD39_SAPPC|nr:hypothetical protein SPRG_10287 [Saprolegnia parasitica CBS 223.65]KDO24471.1 hypothetical protein SPRG_10287 [Saprolegnia parasitica CBS 223.65]|eukprot:XP_012204737.1 hypothetical protein SPRG_10287 [Saprolegnia parasitica CBS 223.65]
MGPWSRVVGALDALEAALGPLLVATGLCLSAFMLYAFLYAMLPPLYALHGACVALGHGAVGLFLFVQMLWNHVLCIRSSPGEMSLMPTIYEDAILCDYCNAPQPPRCTHCHACEACILELDHHCIWMNNCIGYYNYRYFWLYLLYGWLNCAHVAYLADAAMAQRPHDLSFSDQVLLHFPYVICVGLSLALFSLWVVHVYLLVAGQTTLDLLRSEPLRKTLSVTAMRRNVERVFGSPWWRAMLLPTIALRPEKRHRKLSSVPHLVAV